MKIEKLNELNIDNIRDQLSYSSRQELCADILVGASDELLSKVVLEKGSCYEIAAVGGDSECYEWTEETIGDTRSESEAIAIAEKAVNSGDWEDYTIVILQIPDTIDDIEIDADVFEVWRHYVPETQIDESEVEKFRESFRKFLSRINLYDYDDASDLAWNWAIDVDDITVPSKFLDKDGNVKDEDELSNYLFNVAYPIAETTLKAKE